MKEIEVLNHIEAIAQFSEYKREILEYVKRHKGYIKTKRDFEKKKIDKRIENAYDKLFPYLDDEIEKNAGTIYEEFKKDNPDINYPANQIAKDLVLMTNFNLLEQRQYYDEQSHYTIFYYKLKI